MEIKLKLKIKDIEIELSEKEVGELREILKKLFPEPSVQWVPYYPYIGSNPWKWDRWTVWCPGIPDDNTSSVHYTAELT